MFRCGSKPTEPKKLRFGLCLEYTLLSLAPHLLISFRFLFGKIFKFTIEFKTKFQIGNVFKNQEERGDKQNLKSRFDLGGE